MERANGNLQRSHGSNQMNHVVRLIPVGINQRVNTTAFQHQVVINLVAVNIILLAMLIIRGRYRSTMMGNNIRAITPLNLSLIHI